MRVHRQETIKFIQGVFLLSGTIIGVGMFGIPFVFSRSGFFIGLLELSLLTVVMGLVHLMYGEVLLRTETIHRLPGYARLYLGDKAKIISTISYILGLSGSLVAYIIIGGQFLSGIFGMSSVTGSVIFWVAGSIFILFSVRQLGWIDMILNFLEMLFILVFALKAAPYFNGEFISFPLLGDYVLPYGVLFFSLVGAVAVPEVRSLLGNQSGHLLKPIIITGTVIPSVLYTFFAFAVVGISGVSTSPDALSGLLGAIPSGMMIFGQSLGILAAFTSFVVIGLTLKETYYFDWGIRQRFSWALASVVPLALFFLGVNKFIATIGFVGAVAGGIDAIITVLVFWRSKKFGTRTPEFVLSLPRVVMVSIVILFVLGILGEANSILR